jgi:uncharacterized protein (DUF1499 family)
MTAVQIVAFIIFLLILRSALCWVSWPTTTNQLALGVILNQSVYHTFALSLLLPIFFSCTAKPIQTTPDSLPPCPDSPNCVSSLAQDPKHSVAPLTYEGPASEAQERLTTILMEIPNCTIVDSGPLHMHAEFRSRIFRFVDDLMVVFDENHAVIHLRSASRTGYYDFGVNRKRVETIRRLWEERPTR